MRFCPLASGSKGNSIYLETGQTKLLIDAGLSAKAIAERLGQIGVSLDEIDAILISHEHSDHIRGLQSLGCKKGIPILANSDTAKAICATLDDIPKFKIFSTGETFTFGDVEVHPFSIQHDTLDPVAFTLRAEGMKIGVCTDLGFVTTLVRQQLRECDYLYIEANHQPSMVHASNRPMIYKQRVLSRQGHLSNEDCAQLLVDVFHDGLKHVYLAHLSSECNAPDLALKIIRDRFEALGQQVDLSIAWQDHISKLISL